MNSIVIRTKTDRKAALLAGRVLADHADIEVSPESIGDQWPRLVAMLEMRTDPPTADITIDDPTPEAVRAQLAAGAEAEQARAREEAEEQARNAAAYTAAVEELEAAAKAPMLPAVCRANSDLSQVESAYPSIESYSEDLRALTFNGFRRDLPHTQIYSDCGAVRDALVARRDAAVAASKAEVHEANRAALEIALPDLRRIKAEMDAAAEARAREQEARAKEATAAKFAERLATGYWTKETGTYNEKRYSSPWCATVDFSSGPKGNYEFGESTGAWGKAGMLRVKCAPGDIIAYGQKDLRRPANSDHTILRMRPDGGMDDLGDKASAYKVYIESKA